jgi:hypothetical protein
MRLSFQQANGAGAAAVEELLNARIDHRGDALALGYFGTSEVP